MAENEMLMERFGLAMERIGLVQEEQKGRDGVHDFFSVQPSLFAIWQN